ncbi:MAG: GTPase [Verrucomicrobiaceae bacterium]|nr:MAG: GTPase [Verrucomicrobiaceae bacterium]
MSPEEAIYSVCLLAAFADGGASEAERKELKRIGESILPPELHPASLYQQVLLRKTGTREAAAGLDSPEWRQLGYEMAVCVCEADGVTGPAEKEFLAKLASDLGLSSAAAVAVVEQADAVTAAPVDSIDEAILPDLADLQPSGPPALPATAQGGPPQTEVDSLVLRFSILNGALELLPETLSTMAIVPLQMKLVHSVGKLHGVDLDRRHLGEFLAAAGIGATSQIVEGFARKLVGGLVGKFGKQMLGKTAGSLGKTAADQITRITSSAFSFASTYAIGHLAHRYYSNGRSWSGIDSKGTLQRLKTDAEGLHTRYLPQIREQATKLDVGKVLAMVRGR